MGGLSVSIGCVPCSQYMSSDIVSNFAVLNVLKLELMAGTI